jgi:hypothetical protein
VLKAQRNAILQPKRMGCDRLIVAGKRDLAGVPAGLCLQDEGVDQQIVE